MADTNDELKNIILNLQSQINMIKNPKITYAQSIKLPAYNTNVKSMNYDYTNDDEKIYTTIDKVIDPNRIWSDLIAEAHSLSFEDGKYKVSCRNDGIVGYPDAIARAFCGAAFNEYMEECAAPNCYLYYYDRIWKPTEEADSKYQFCAKYGDYQSDLADEEQTAQELTGVKRKYINYVSHTGISGITASKINWYVKVNSDNCYYWPRDTFSDNLGWARFMSYAKNTDSMCACIDTSDENTRLVITILFNNYTYTLGDNRNGFLRYLTAAATPTIDANCTSIYDAWKNGTLSSLTINNALYASLDKVSVTGSVSHLWDNTTTSSTFVYPMCGKILAEQRVHVPGFQGILTAQFLDYDQAQTEINLGYDSQINPKLIFSQNDTEYLGKTESYCINAVPRKEYAQIRKVLMVDLLNNNRYADNALRVYAVGTSSNYRDVTENNLLVPQISMGSDWTSSAVEISFPAASTIGEAQTASGPNQVQYYDKIGATLKKHYIRLDKVDDDGDDTTQECVTYSDVGLSDGYTISFAACFETAKNGECVFQTENAKLYYLKSSTKDYITVTGATTSQALKLVTQTQQIIAGISEAETWAMPTKVTLQYKNGLWGLKITYTEYST